jgi:hypothetical protein
MDRALRFLKSTSVSCTGVPAGVGVAAEDNGGVVPAGEDDGALGDDVDLAGWSGSSCAGDNIAAITHEQKTKSRDFIG